MGQEVDARTDIFAVGIILWELLAGQRLFLGDTDFQTVKKVQAAQRARRSRRSTRRSRRSSSASSPGRSRATPRSATRRRATSGRTSSKFLFKYGVPVSTFDIASLVQGAMKERQRHRPMQACIIDKLIEEALFEFTSLTDDKQAPTGGAKPLESLKGPTPRAMPVAGPGGYVNVGSWIDEISVDQKPDDDALRASLPPGVEEGNLAALEEDPASSPQPAMRAAMAPPMASAPLVQGGAVPTPLPSPRQPLPVAPASAPALGPDKKSSAGSKVMVVVALVVVMAAGAAAWFTHLIPHP